MLHSNKFFLLVGATVMAGVLCVLSAMADVPRPESLRAYQSLGSVELRSVKQPKFQGGIKDLSKKESRYTEQLPMQLDGAVKTISARKYKHSSSGSRL